MAARGESLEGSLITFNVFEIAVRVGARVCRRTSFLLVGLQTSNYGSRHIVSIKNRVSLNILSRPEPGVEVQGGLSMTEGLPAIPGRGTRFRGFGTLASVTQMERCTLFSMQCPVSDGLRGLADGGGIS